MRRGEVWLVHGLGRDRHVLVVGNDIITASSGSALVATVDLGDALITSLVTVRITEPVSGVVRAHEISMTRKERFAEALGIVDAATMDMVDAALRTALDL